MAILTIDNFANYSLGPLSLWGDWHAQQGPQYPSIDVVDGSALGDQGRGWNGYIAPARDRDIIQSVRRNRVNSDLDFCGIGVGRHCHRVLSAGRQANVAGGRRLQLSHELLTTAAILLQ